MNDTRPGSEVVELRFEACFVKAVTDTSIGVLSKPRDMILWFPRRVPMTWVMSRSLTGTEPDVTMGTQDLRPGDRLTAVQLPAWLKRAKMEEVQHAAQPAAMAG